MMFSERIRLPVTIPEMSGLMEAVGLLRADENGVILELQKQDSIIRAYKSGIGTYKIAFSDIESIELEKKLFSTRLIITTLRMNTLENVPGSKQGQCILQIDRKDKKTAEDVASSLKMQLSEVKLKNMDSEL